MMQQFLESFSSSLPSGSILAFGVALVAGVLASGVCPCTLPMGLGMAGMVSSSSATPNGTLISTPRRTGIFIAISFFIGVVVNLTLLGLLASRLGQVMTINFGRYWAGGMAIASLLAAALAFWGPRLKTSQLANLRMPGLTGAFVYGFLFSLGTSAAPLLVLLTVAAAQNDLLYGTSLSLFFGLGRGLPFLLVGVFADAIMRFARLSLWRQSIQAVSGIALLIVSAYYAKTFWEFMS